ncbi:MAG TPA: PP0621 family protein [Usitatibacter sp.]|jgi:uncharacterized protein|nr:PP0621 family protein [Usitatibacter sp.]
MSRILFFLLVFVAIYLAVKGMARKESLRERAAGRRADLAKGEDMVTCARCGVHVPRSEARAESGHLVCADNPRCRASA